MPDAAISMLQHFAKIDAPVTVTQICVETMMHLTCTNMPQEKLEEALTKVSRQELVAAGRHL